MEMSENDETIRSGSDLAIMKTEPRPKWNKNIFKIHTSLQGWELICIPGQLGRIWTDQQKVYFWCFTSSLMAVTEIFTTNKNQTISVSIKEMEQSEGQMTSDQDDQNFFSSIELW